MKKTAVLLLLLILASTSIISAKTAFAQSIPKPSVPEFTTEFVAHPYDVASTTSIDPYTGNEIIHQGYRVENTSIQFRIKNQAFNPFYIMENENSWTVNLFYNIRIRGHFAQTQDWIELYYASDGYPHQFSDSDFTILSYPFEEGSSTKLGSKMVSLPVGGQVDFQVEAMIGYIHREITIPVPGTGWVFTGETSGWSNTQTLTLSDSSVSPAPTPTVPEFPIIAIVPILFIIPLAATVLLRKKRR